ncbi:Cysteine desulfurase, partial [hydrothermal vent metagenome]
NWLGCEMAVISSHKLGGPKGVGALVVKRGTDIAAQIRGGGQEMGRRAGTENVIGIAGFGAAAEAAQRDLQDGVWARVEKLRNILETAIAHSAKETIFVGKSEPRLPNTSCFITPGWKGETQVMAMDLAGFAISAGSACSSGKVRASHVLAAMGFDATLAGCAVRVSLGPETTEDEVRRFAESWTDQRAKYRARAA